MTYQLDDARVYSLWQHECEARSTLNGIDTAHIDSSILTLYIDAVGGC